MSIPSKIKRWYLGGPLPTRERISDTAETIRLPNTFEPSLSARIVRSFVGFYLRNWQWFGGCILAIVLAVYFGH
ncbi:MAG TPA: hypothetical protein VN283_06150 [Thiobacillus sp.]|nr:hypothetical protein [Thiobacillus sp.]